MFLKYDYCIADRFGIGLSMGYFSAEARATNAYNRNYSPSPGDYTQTVIKQAKSFSVGCRVNYHFGEGEKADPYIGLAAGYTEAFIMTSYETNDPVNTGNFVKSPYRESQPVPLYLAATVGVRLYLTENIGIYGEAGFDKWALAQAGLAFRIN